MKKHICKNVTDGGTARSAVCCLVWNYAHPATARWISTVLQLRLKQRQRLTLPQCNEQLALEIKTESFADAVGRRFL